MTKQRALEILQERLDLAERNGNGVGDYYDVLRVAIEAIKQQNPNGRMLYQSGYQQGVKDGQPKWIPCSERLPNTIGIYSVTRGMSDGFEYRNITDACYFDGLNTWHDDTRVNHERKYLADVLAWMPLPDPWEGEEG